MSRLLHDTPGMIAHTAAHEALVSWTPPSSEQERLRDDFVRCLVANSDGCGRTGRPDHLTASALVVDDEGTRVLLGLHRKVGRWLQFGGHIENDDLSLADAALREAREESGIADLTLLTPSPARLDRHRAPCGDGARYHLDVQYVAVSPPGAEPTTSAESLDVAWFMPDALPADTDDAVRALVAHALRLG